MMRFSVIYSVDVPRDESIRPYLPTQKHLFQMTEGDDQYEYSYLEGVWTKGKHRKLCAWLNKKQFERFLSDTGLFAEDVETMGSLGAPGLGYGIVPAVSFRNDDPIAIQGAYVTPIPWNETEDEELYGLLLDKHRFITLPFPNKDELEEKAKEAYAGRIWRRVREATISTYAN
jgi:hypothetical protein